MALKPKPGKPAGVKLLVFRFFGLLSNNFFSAHDPACRNPSPALWSTLKFECQDQAGLTIMLMPLDLASIIMSHGSKTSAWTNWRVLKCPFSGYRFTF
jgi:hypothetical protein